MIQDEVERADAFGEIAEVEARAGNRDAALVWIRKLDSPMYQSRALLGLANGILQKAKASPVK